MILKNRITPTSLFHHEINELVFSEDSDFQKIEVVDCPDLGRVLVLDGVVNLTEADEWIYHEMLVHVPLFSHPNPEKVLIVGGGDGCAAREVFKHKKIKRLVQVELDPMVMEVSRKYLGRLEHALDDPRLEIVCMDAVRYLKENQESFDAILMDSTDPGIENSSGLFSLDYYKNCLAALGENGVLSAQVGDSFFEPQVVAPVFERLGRVFPLVRMYLAAVPVYAPFPYGLALCAKNPDLPGKPVREPDIEGLRYYSDKIHRAAFTLPAFIKDRFFQKA